MSASVIPFKATNNISKAHQMVQTTSYEQLVVHLAHEILCEMDEVYQQDCPIDVDAVTMREVLIERMTSKFGIPQETILDDLCRAISKIELQKIPKPAFTPLVVAL